VDLPPRLALQSGRRLEITLHATASPPERRMYRLAHDSQRRPTAAWQLGLFLTAFLCIFAGAVQATRPDDPKAMALDQQILAESKKGSEQIANLTYLSDMIGPRLTGSAALRRANDWTEAKMKAYGLVNVHQEAWLMPEGWERGTATGRILEPDNGRSLSLASYGWHPGTNGKVQGDVLIVQATKTEDLDAYKGKLRGAIVMEGPPKKLTPLADIEKGGLGLDQPKKDQPQANWEERFAMMKAKNAFYQQEGVAAILVDANKHHGLLFTTGGWNGTERPSLTKKVPMLAVAHEHYGLLHRLASRGEPARTRIELEVTNKFIEGPIKVYNTIGEIRGKEKPEEVVVVGAHLDSWDLGQGTVDNGTGTSVVLETARILTRCPAPKRTIRFILFTGEEQGLHGSRAYTEQHKAELDKISACIVHDTGTGKVLTLGWMKDREALAAALEPVLAEALKELGVKDVCARGFGGSDHMSFDKAGVPGCAFNQEIAGYRFGHHSQADTMDLVREDDLRQGTQVMAITATRLANMDKLLPRAQK
jgi:carboxypeptidase Q